jgi:hypothetical protein
MFEVICSTLFSNVEDAFFAPEKRLLATIATTAIIMTSKITISADICPFLLPFKAFLELTAIFIFNKKQLKTFFFLFFFVCQLF